MKRLLSAITLITLALLASCSSSAQPDRATQPNRIGQTVSMTGGSYTNVTPDELQAMLKSKDFLFVNVHIPFEGNIANTDLSIPYNEIDRNLDKLPADKNAMIVLYCRYERQRLRGPGYDLPNVPYVMYFYQGYAMHGTYWHNNFGQPMSYGCVNLPTGKAAWLFKWAPRGTRVVVH